MSNPLTSQPNLLGLTRDQLDAWFAEAGERSFRSSQVLQWIHRHGVTDFDAMTNLGKPLRQHLAATAEIVLPELLTARQSRDGTRKWLMRLADGNVIEVVFIPEAGRGTLCVSSQVGCALDCTFCSTARQGFNRNLTSAEIIGQLWLARHALAAEPSAAPQITNVVMMGMGEPLLNLDNVVCAMRLMKDDHAYGLSRRKVTLSTSGVVPAMDKLRAAIDVSLAVSLHAPGDALRTRLVPLNRKYPIETLMAACWRYIHDQPAKHHVTFEYAMLDGVNDGEHQARALVALLRDMPAKVNLIPFNPFPGAPYARSSQAAIDRFRDTLMQAGIVTVTRRPRGDDIDAACGQLVGEFQDRSHREQHFIRLQKRADQESTACRAS